MFSAPIKKPLPVGSGRCHRYLLCQIRAGRAIAPPTVESPPTSWALRGSETFCAVLIVQARTGDFTFFAPVLNIEAKYLSRRSAGAIRKLLNYF
jgi:hypothetical protein